MAFLLALGFFFLYVLVQGFFFFLYLCRNQESEHGNPFDSIWERETKGEKNNIDPIVGIYYREAWAGRRHR